MTLLSRILKPALDTFNGTKKLLRFEDFSQRGSSRSDNDGPLLRRAFKFPANFPSGKWAGTGRTMSKVPSGAMCRENDTDNFEKLTQLRSRSLLDLNSCVPPYHMSDTGGLDGYSFL